MAQPRKELSNVYGRLTVLSDAPYKGASRQVWVRCVCGKELVVGASNLRSGNTTSCGCAHYSTITTHGQSQTRLYHIWKGMWERCTNPVHEAYTRYGGAGITITPEWVDIHAFVAWATTSGYSELLTLDRKNNAEGYSPTNCRWATKTTQQRNRNSARGASSKYVGVGYFKLTGRWKAGIKVNGKPIHLGYFSTEIEAAKARDQYILDNKLSDFKLNGVLP